MKRIKPNRVTLEALHTHTHTHTHTYVCVSGYLTYKKVINNIKTQVLYILFCYCKLGYRMPVSFYCGCLKAELELQPQYAVCKANCIP